MKRSIAIIIIAAMAVMGSFAANKADSVAGRPNSVGLVLSGGGAKGIAEIGYIQALEENDIPIDYITGTSMGSIVGSLYACGKTPAQMMELIKSREFKEWSSGQIPLMQRYAFMTPRSTPSWLSVCLGTKRGGDKDEGATYSFLPTRLINPLPMSWAFLELYAPYTGECDGNFDRLMVPLRTVASDVMHHRPVVFSHGQVADAVRASMSFPLVFQPIMVDGALLFDGGLYDVYPVDVMMDDFRPKRVIGVNVSSPNTKPSLNSVLGQLDAMIINDIDYPFPDSIGINTRFHLNRYGLLAWNDADTIYNIGYRRALSQMDSIKALIPWRRSQQEVTAAREAFAKRTPVVRFSDVVVKNTTPQRERFIKYLFGDKRDADGLISESSARSGFYRIASSGRLRNLEPHAIYNDTTGTYRLELDADVEPDLKLGLGGYVTSSAGSMLYASAAYMPFELGTVGASLQGWAGQCSLGTLGEAWSWLPSRVPSRLLLQVALTRKNFTETERMFYDFSKPSFLHHSEFYTKLKYEIAAGTHGTITIAGGYGHLTDRYTSLNHATMAGVDHVFLRDLGQGEITYNYTTLNDPMLPTRGMSVKLQAGVDAGSRFVRGLESFDGAWGRFTASWLGYMELGEHWSIGLGADAHYSTFPLISDYNAAVVAAMPFSPLASGYYLYDPATRANQWTAVSLHPVWKPSGMLQVRADGWLYAPMRSIEKDAATGRACYSGWFDNAYFLGEFTVAMQLPFGAVRGYFDYRSTPGKHFSGGISLGLPLHTPEF